MRTQADRRWSPPLLLGLVLLLSTLGCPGDSDDDDTTDGPPGYASAVVLELGDDAIAGPLAGAVPGDVLVENDHIRAVLQQPGRAIALNPYGGNLIDADVVRGDGLPRDHFGEAGLWLNSHVTMAPDTMEIVDDGASGEAVVRFEGPGARSDYIDAAVGMQQMMGLSYPIDTLDIPQVWITMTYTLAAGDAHVRVDVQVRNDGDGALPVVAGWLVHGGLAENYYPRLGGFKETQIAQAGALLVPAEEVAYGFAPLPYTPDAHGLGYMAGGSVLIDGHSILEILDWPGAATAELQPGEIFSFDAALVVSRDLSGVLSLLRDLGEEPVERSTIEGAVVVEGSEHPVPFARVAALVPGDDEVLAATVAGGDGGFSLEVPAGEVELICGKQGWPYHGGGAEPGRVPLDAGSDAEQELTLPPTGALRVTAEDGSGAAIPARVLVLGLDPSPPVPPLHATGMDPLPPGVAAALDLPVGGELTVDLEPGEYDVVVRRGMEYDAIVETVEVTTAADTAVHATLHRVLDTAGMLTGDFHIHAAAGPDTVLLDEGRVANYAADGVEVLVGSNHAYVMDFAPVIDDLALEPWVGTIPSQEVTTFDYGHFGLFPMVHEPLAPNGGAFDWVGVSPSEIFEWGQTQDREMVVQINHPRAIPTPAEMQNFFTVLDLVYDQDGPAIGDEHFDPLGTGLPPDSVMFGAGFTAMEVMTWINVQGLSDWFNLLSAGHRFTATANSDSHTTRVESSGWPRNFVLCGQDDPSTLDAEDFVADVNAGKLSGSFGPLVVLTAQRQDGGPVAEMGDLLDTGGGAVRVRAWVQAAEWAAVDTLDLYADGELVTSHALQLQAVDGAEGGTRLEQWVEIVVDAPTDTYVAAVVHGSDPLYPVLPYNETDPDEITLQRIRDRNVVDPATPFGYANPVFLDADGDGVITPSYHVMPADWLDYRREDRLDPY